MSNATLDFYFTKTKKLDNYSPLLAPQLFYYANLHGLQLTIDFVQNTKKGYSVKTCGWLPPRYSETNHLNALTWNKLDSFGSLNEALKVFYECLQDLIDLASSEVRL